MKANKSEAAIVAQQKAAGWEGFSFEPRPGKCKRCGEPIPPTQKRGEAFGGYGRPREFCGARCRKAWSRAR